jgi:hypothetical protein
VKKVLDGPDTTTTDARSGLKITKLKDHLLIYRYGVLKVWLDLELKYLVKWNLTTQAEVAGFNTILIILGMGDYYTFLRTKRTILVKAGEHFYYSDQYNSKFGPEGGNY